MIFCIGKELKARENKNEYIVGKSRLATNRTVELIL
jgi:hypothetical protein